MNKAYERPPEETIADYQRRQEILFDVAMELGRSYALLSESVRSQLMDQLNGSRGLFDLVVQWVEEFDREWETSENDPERQYLESVDEFTHAKLVELVSTLPTQAPPDRFEKVRQTYLKRFAEHERKLGACESIRPVLSDQQHAWHTAAHVRMRAETDRDQLDYTVRAMGVLVGKAIHDLHAEGVTYMRISAAIGISASRTSMLAGQYESAVKLKDARQQNGRPTFMPWL